MATITFDAEGPGKAAKRPVLTQSGRVMKIVTGVYAFDNSYPTGGEDISAIFSEFQQVLGMLVEQPITGAQTGKFVKVDYTNKKLQLFTNASPAVEVANASDQSAITALRFIVWGY